MIRETSKVITVSPPNFLAQIHQKVTIMMLCRGIREEGREIHYGIKLLNGSSCVRLSVYVCVYVRGCRKCLFMEFVSVFSSKEGRQKSSCSILHHFCIQVMKCAQCQQSLIIFPISLYKLFLHFPAPKYVIIGRCFISDYIFPRTKHINVQFSIHYTYSRTHVCIQGTCEQAHS